MQVSCEPIGAIDDRPHAGLVTALSDDDRRSLRVLYSSHRSTVYRYVLSLCGDHVVAEDVTQDVFEGIARTVDDPSSVTVAWLLRRARCRMIDLVRRRKSYAAKLELLGGEDRHGSEDENEVTERLRLRRAMDQLSDEQRTTLRLHYVDGLTVAQIATHLARSNKSVERVITRARAALRSELDHIGK